MEKLFFFITNNDAWKQDTGAYSFHVNYFITNHGFLYGILLALIVALLLALIYYFGCANSKRDSTLATMPVWCGFLAITAVVVFLIADLVYIGKPGVTDRSSIFRRYSFYEANAKYEIDMNRNNTNEQLSQSLKANRQRIETALNHRQDVRYPYSFACAVWSVLFFYGFSLCMKGLTYHGIGIPHLWPYKSK